MKAKEPIGEYYSLSHIRNMRLKIIKSIREEENIDVLKQHMQLQNGQEERMNLSRKQRRELFDSQTLINTIDAEIPWEEMKNTILKEKYNL